MSRLTTDESSFVRKSDWQRPSLLFCVADMEAEIGHGAKPVTDGPSFKVHLLLLLKRSINAFSNWGHITGFIHCFSEE
jgi:hypothetical protein